jgi:hypothetical protein
MTQHQINIVLAAELQPLYSLMRAADVVIRSHYASLCHTAVSALQHAHG